MALYHFKQERMTQSEPEYKTNNTTPNYTPQNYCLKDLNRMKENELLSSCYSTNTLSSSITTSASKKSVSGPDDKAVLLGGVDLGAVMIQTVMEEMRLISLEQQDSHWRLAGS